MQPLREHSKTKLCRKINPYRICRNMRGCINEANLDERL